MTTKEKPASLDELTRPQPDSDDPTYLAHVEKKIRQGQEDVKRGRTHSEEEVWKALGIEN